MAETDAPAEGEPAAGAAATTGAEEWQQESSSGE